VFVCIQQNGRVKPDTVGPPIAGVEVKIKDTGEILLKSPGLLKEYYKNPRRLPSDGRRRLYHTGDAGISMPTAT